ncbi:MAG TPA: serine/threonine-protein kinase, partial [Gemmatimonadales bacterium]|nr:serine/threonine-protein kinase [Gemmatimonadales bacterium]
MADPIVRLTQALAGRYVLEHEIGSGGTAVVILARDLRHERLVAIKVLRPELAASLGADRFLREIKIAAGLTHPHILSVHDSGEADGLLYYVMPYVEGESLRARLQREGALPVDDALRIAREVADALSYAHSRGVVHRDIKPGNILLIGGHAVVADFGIATAAGAEGDALTDFGLVVGTPAYMSPEQAGGGAAVDGRSDLYSLGCVVYEMLTGKPPFTGVSAQAVLARHSHDPPAPVRSHRPSVPIEVDAIVQRLLAKLPADRYATASQFVAALPLDTGEPGAGPPAKRRIGLRTWGGAVAAAGLMAAVLLTRPQSGAALDESLYLVLPFQHRGQSAPVLLDGDRCESLLHQALARWRGVSVVDPLWVRDAGSRRGPAPPSLESGMAMAHVRGAGAMVSGEVWQAGDTLFVRGAVYDVSGKGRVLREHTVRLNPDLSDAWTRFEELADALVTGSPPPTSANGFGTRSLAAWRAYDAGREALLAWDLPTARHQLEVAVVTDPGYAEANLALATVMSWNGDHASDWRRPAAAAVAADTQLQPETRREAKALLNLADGRFVEACDDYRELTRRDSLDFGAWFGLGECLARDPAVVPDSRSRSGWSFRTSYHSAANAYRRALETYPSVHRAFNGFALGRITGVLPTEPNQYRLGFSLRPDTVWMAAFPSLDHDTLEYVPWPLADVLGGKREANPPTTATAVAYSRETLRGIAATWLRAYPKSPDALESYAAALELAGELDDSASIEHSALRALLAARAGTSDSTQATRLARMEVRVRLKLGQFGPARHLADSLLAAVRDPTPDEAQWLAGLAALTGQANRAARLLSQTAGHYDSVPAGGRLTKIPAPLAAAALAYLAFASVGGPTDSIASTARRTSELISSYVDAERSGDVRAALIEPPLALSLARPGVQPPPYPATGHHPLLPLFAAWSRGDTAHARRGLDSLRAFRGGTRPGDYSIEGSLLEAWLMTQLGDSAAAAAFLDLSL